MLLGRIKNGRIQIQRFFKRDLEKAEGKEVEISVVDGGKTAQQLRYLWGIVYPIISDVTGFEKEEVSEVYKKRFLTYSRSYKGKIYKLTKGLSSLKKKEMAEFIDKVIRHATVELNCIIPESDPDFVYID